jgi:hypothetical protein
MPSININTSRNRQQKQCNPIAAVSTLQQAELRLQFSTTQPISQNLQGRDKRKNTAKSSFALVLSLQQAEAHIMRFHLKKRHQNQKTPTPF